MDRLGHALIRSHRVIVDLATLLSSPSPKAEHGLHRLTAASVSRRSSTPGSCFLAELPSQKVLTTFLEDRPFARTYEVLPKPADIGDAVADDPYGIALMGFFDASKISAIRPLAVATEPGTPFLLPTFDNVAAEHVPFPAYLHVYINREPGKPVDPFVKEYMRMLLSEKGQAIIATQTDTDEGYVPLSPDRIQTELHKLD